MKKLIIFLYLAVIFGTAYGSSGDSGTGTGSTDFSTQNSIPQLDLMITENATDATAPVLSNIGISFDILNASTKVAGDFRFLNLLLVPAGEEDDNTLSVFYPFGTILTNSLGTKVLNYFEYRPSEDADVTAVTGGIVSRVELTPVNPFVDGRDYNIFMRPNDHSFWRIRHEHITDPQVSEGDVISAGTVLGKPGVLSVDGLGRTELHIDNLNTGTLHCPVSLLSSEVRADIESKLNQFFKDWENFKSNNNIFDESSMPITGCTEESVASGAEPPFW